MDKVSIHTQSHLCILKLDSLFIVPIVRFSAVSLYAKRFLLCNQKLLRNPEDSLKRHLWWLSFYQSILKKNHKLLQRLNIFIKQTFYWGSFQSWKVKRHVLWQDYNWIIYWIQSNLKEKHGGKEYCSTIVGKWKMIQYMQ